MKRELNITPKSNVINLVKTYPELEDIVVDLFPAFKMLKTPLLKNSIAKFVTLKTVAFTGKIKVGVLIDKLVEAAISHGYYDEIVRPEIKNINTGKSHDDVTHSCTDEKKENSSGNHPRVCYCKTGRF